jgi:hypothetical protein
MVMNHTLVPLSDAIAEKMRADLVIYWTAVDNCEDLGGIPWDLVYEKRSQVMDLLTSGQVNDVYEASRLTAKFECERQSS